MNLLKGAGLGMLGGQSRESPTKRNVALKSIKLKPIGAKAE